MKKLATVLVILMCMVVHAKEAGTSKKMTYIKYRLEGGNLSDFAKLPKEMWRVGNDQMRSLELPDKKEGIWSLYIYNPPDYWAVNLYDKTGVHGFDAGPTFNSICPIFSHSSEKAFMKFEFGFETEYLKKHNIDPTTEIQSDTVAILVYEFEIAGSYINLMVDKNTQNPIQITALKDKVKYKVLYDEYKTGLQPVDSLFLPPSGINLKEAKR